MHHWLQFSTFKNSSSWFGNYIFFFQKPKNPVKKNTFTSPYIFFHWSVSKLCFVFCMCYRISECLDHCLQRKTSTFQEDNKKANNISNNNISAVTGYENHVAHTHTPVAAVCWWRKLHASPSAPQAWVVPGWEAVCCKWGKSSPTLHWICKAM